MSGIIYLETLDNVSNPQLKESYQNRRIHYKKGVHLNFTQESENSQISDSLEIYVYI